MATDDCTNIGVIRSGGTTLDGWDLGFFSSQIASKEQFGKNNAFFKTYFNRSELNFFAHK